MNSARQIRCLGRFIRVVRAGQTIEEPIRAENRCKWRKQNGYQSMNSAALFETAPKSQRSALSQEGKWSEANLRLWISDCLRTITRNRGLQFPRTDHKGQYRAYESGRFKFEYRLRGYKFSTYATPGAFRQSDPQRSIARSGRNDPNSVNMIDNDQTRFVRTQPQHFLPRYIGRLSRRQRKNWAATALSHAA